MKVLICFNESLHYGLAAASRVSWYARGLKENEIESEVIMPFTFLARKNIFFEQKGSLQEVNYQYLSYLGYHPKNKYFFPLSGIVLLTSKWWGYCKYFVYFFKNYRKYDVVFIYKFSTFFSFFLLLFNCKKICISELSEIPYHNSTGFAKKANRFIREHTIFKMFDGFVVISQNLIDYIRRYKSPGARLIKVPILTGNGFIDSNYENSSSISIPQDPYLLHTGSITEQKDGIIGMIESFGIAKRKLKKSIKLIITGNLEYSPDKQSIIRSIEKYNLFQDVVFVGFLSTADLKLLQSNCALAIINKYENEQNFYCFPTKLADYLLNSIAVIATSVGEINHYLIDNINAYIVEPANVEMMADKIVLAFSSDEKRLEIAGKGRLLAETEFNYYIHGKRLKQYFQDFFADKK